MEREHVKKNRVAWNEFAKEYVEAGETAWKSTPRWGIWGIPEEEVHLLPKNLEGLDCVELGCGTAYVSSWLSKRGARPVGIDTSSEQLKTARRLQVENNLFFPLIHASAEDLPLSDHTFDYAISEYGASIWCDPYRWIPEASRLLRPGGRLVFLVNGTILMLCAPDDGSLPVGPSLVRDYYGMHRFEFPDEPRSVEFHLGYGDWIRLLRKNGFEVEDMKEFKPGEESTTRYPIVKLDWAKRWPAEEAWIVRKTA